MLKIEHLRKSFELGTPLKDVSCEIHKGDVIAIIGPSGCGKSTFINCINRLIEPSGGRIFFDGEEITSSSNLEQIRMRMGMVFQSFLLFPHMTILENITLAPMSLKKMSKTDAYHKAMALLDQVGLASKADRYPTELSGGQQQRVAICRSLAMEPEILLLDEPTSALDPTMVGEVENVIRKLAQSGLTMMIVTHEMNFARSVANRIFYMDEGTIYEEGTPEQIFDFPKRERTRWFINRMQIFEEEICADDFDIYQLQSRIGAFTRGQMISSRSQTLIQLVFEELGYAVLMKHLSHGEKMLFRLACDNDESIELTFTVPGDELSDGGIGELDEIASRIFNSAIIPDSFRCHYEAGVNTISMGIGGCSK